VHCGYPGRYPSRDDFDKTRRGNRPERANLLPLVVGSSALRISARADSQLQ
jgi:hypothetical protein